MSLWNTCMKCPMGPKSEKKFWGFKWISQEDHRLQIVRVEAVSKNFSGEFRVYSECKYCGKPEVFYRVKWDTMIKYGIDNDVLSDILRGKSLELLEGNRIDVKPNSRIGD